MLVGGYIYCFVCSIVMRNNTHTILRQKQLYTVRYCLVLYHLSRICVFGLLLNPFHTHARPPQTYVIRLAKPHMARVATPRTLRIMTTTAAPERMNFPCSFGVSRCHPPLSSFTSVWFRVMGTRFVVIIFLYESSQTVAAFLAACWRLVHWWY